MDTSIIIIKVHAKSINLKLKFLAFHSIETL